MVPQDRYWVSIPASRQIEYWVRKPDPDGVIRDRCGNESEEAQYLGDMAEQFAFLKENGVRSVLDFGCGSGWFLDEARRRGISVAGVERCPIALAECESRRLDVAMDICTFDGTFDCVRCHHVIEHLDDPKRDFFDLVPMILRRGGWLIVATPDFASPCAARFGDRYRMLHDETHCSLFSLESLQRLLTAYNYDTVRVDYPFPRRYATMDTMRRWLANDGISPPWPGNHVTIYARWNDAG